jgi:multiple sugar transport system substrate-binding protein
VYQNGGELVDKSGRHCYFDSPTVTEAVQWWANTVCKDGILPNQQEGEGLGDAMFVNERSAMGVCGPWMIGYYRKNCKFDWDIVNMPCGKAGNKSRLTGLPIGISPHCKHFEEAYRLLKYLCWSTEAQTMQAELGVAMPARRDIAESDAFMGQKIMPPGIGIFLDTMKTGTLIENVFPYQSKVKQAYRNMLDGANLGQQSAAELGRYYQKEIEREIQKAVRRHQL